MTETEVVEEQQGYVYEREFSEQVAKKLGVFAAATGYDSVGALLNSYIIRGYTSDCEKLTKSDLCTLVIILAEQGVPNETIVKSMREFEQVIYGENVVTQTSK